jgi:hypothetical protein
MERQGRILAADYPEDWKYYTLAHPVATYKNFTWEELTAEMNRFDDLFNSYPKIFLRILRVAVRNRQRPLQVFLCAVANLTYRGNHRSDRREYCDRRCAATPAGVAAAFELKSGPVQQRPPEVRP